MEEDDATIKINQTYAMLCYAVAEFSRIYMWSLTKRSVTGYIYYPLQITVYYKTFRDRHKIKGNLSQINLWAIMHNTETEFQHHMTWTGIDHNKQKMNLTSSGINSLVKTQYMTTLLVSINK